MQVYNTDAQIPDSSGTGTAFLCGHKANVGTLGVTHHVERNNCSNVADNEVMSIIDWSKAAGTFCLIDEHSFYKFS